MEAWAESFLENRRQQRRQRQGPVANAPYSENENGDENRARRSTDGHTDKKRPDDTEGVSVELEELVAREVNEWRSDEHQSGLRLRKKADVMDEVLVHLYSRVNPV